jgi:hypothetical protein
MSCGLPPSFGHEWFAKRRPLQVRRHRATVHRRGSVGEENVLEIRGSLPPPDQQSVISRPDTPTETHINSSGHEFIAS